MSYAPWVIQPLTNITRGDSDEEERIGDSIRFKSFSIRGRFWFNNEPNFADQFYYRRTFRIIVFWDLKPDTSGTAIDPYQMFTFSSGGNEQYTNVYAFKRHDYRFRTKILYDRTYGIDNFHPQRHFKFSVKDPRMIQYNGNNNLINANLYLLIIASDGVPILPNQPQTAVDYQYLLHYVDP